MIDYWDAENMAMMHGHDPQFGGYIDPATGEIVCDASEYYDDAIGSCMPVLSGGGGGGSTPQPIVEPPATPPAADYPEWVLPVAIGAGVLGLVLVMRK